MNTRRINVNSSKEKETQTLYEFSFVKALCDCFPHKVNFRDINDILRLRTVDVNQKLRDCANRDCENWIDQHFLGKIPEIFLESKVLFQIKCFNNFSYRRISVTDGIIVIDFIIEPPVSRGGLNVWHRVREADLSE